MFRENVITQYHRIDTEYDISDEEIELLPDPRTYDIPTSNKTRWNHIHDLDSFLNRVYHYHQNSGFYSVIGKEFLNVLLYVFVLVWSLFLYVGIDYEFLFKTKDPSHSVEWTDCINSLNEMWQQMTWIMLLFFGFSMVCLIFKIGCFISNYQDFVDVRRFYNEELKIDDKDIEDFTWNEVQTRLLKAQIEHKMCISREIMSQLDIYHRILRFENYFIAMMKMNIIPLNVKIPFLGEVTFLTKTLRCNLNFFLFYSNFFSGNLHDDYKLASKRHALAISLKHRFIFASIINLIFCPIVLFLQLTYSFFPYIEIIKNKPWVLAQRRWSCFGKVTFRLYNELDHELHARLNRGYKSATQYMQCFSSKSMSIFASFVLSICSIIFLTIFALSCYDHDVYAVNNGVMLIAILVSVMSISKAFIPDDYLDQSPEDLMTNVLAHVHFLPDSWKDRAHTSQVKNEFAKYFQIRYVGIIENIVSIFMTPIMLYILSGKTLKMVDFLRNFTVNVNGVGDVCSFAQMNIRKHGHYTWHPQLSTVKSNEKDKNSRPTLRDDGKTELSLIHFTLTNPNWKPPQDSVEFLHQIKKSAFADFNELTSIHENSFIGSVNSVSLNGLGSMNLTQRWLNNKYRNETASYSRANQIEGSIQGSRNGILGYVKEELETSSNMYNSEEDLRHPLQFQDIAVNMSVSALYIYDFHRKLLDTEKAQNQSIDMPQSNISESCYNSTGLPSMDLSGYITPTALTNMYNLSVQSNTSIHNSLVQPITEKAQNQSMFLDMPQSNMPESCSNSTGGLPSMDLSGDITPTALTNMYNLSVQPNTSIHGSSVQPITSIHNLSAQSNTSNTYSSLQ